MALSVMEIRGLIPQIRQVPQFEREGSTAETAGIPARDLDVLLGMLSLDAHQVNPFRVAARNRAAMNPDEIVGPRSFLAMRDEALRRGFPEAASVFSGLAELAQSGEMEAILAGERTASVRREAVHTMRRLGKAQFDIGDTVLSKVTPELGRGIVVDFSEDGAKPIVQWNSIESREENAGDLTRTATQRPAPKSSRADFDDWFQGMLAEKRRPPEDPFRRSLRAAAPAVTAAEVVRRKLSACGMHMPPEIATIAFVNDPNPHHPDEPVTGHARVVVRARSAGGANLDLEIPVPYRGDDFAEPEIFAFGGFDYELSRESLMNLMAHYAGAPLPHLVTPFQAGPMPIMTLPTLTPNGVFASPPDLPARYPGI